VLNIIQDKIIDNTNESIESIKQRMNKALTIGFILIVFISCDNRNENVKSQNDKDSITINKNKLEVLIEKRDTIEKSKQLSEIKIEDTSKVIPEKTNYENFEVIFLDFHEDWLQRVFVSIDTSNIYDTSIIQSIVCKIRDLYDTDNKSNISFFSEKKYADYKTTLFIDEGHPYPIEEYDNWMNYYYLAEYEFETTEYKTYPSCRKDYERQKTIKIKCE
jgi:hypothetical protein